MASRRIPALQAQAFVACRNITNDSLTGEIVIVGPVGRLRAVLSVREPVPPWEWRATEKDRRRVPAGR